MPLFVNASATCTLFHSISVACYCVLCQSSWFSLSLLALCLHLTAKDYGAFQMSALEIKSKGMDKSFMTADMSSLKC